VSARYHERFRAALASYAEGVHCLNAPAAPARIRELEAALGRALPQGYRDFLLSWDGAELFHEDVIVFGCDGCLAENRERAAAFTVARDAADSRFAIAPAGPVVELEAETGLRWQVASEFARWLDLVMARGGMLYDREGEFREGAFVGDEVAPEVERKWLRRALRLDPKSAKLRYQLGKSLADGGDARAAEAAIAEATRLDPGAAWAWFDLSRLLLVRGECAAAEAGFVAAATADPEFEQAGYFYAWAARAALLRRDEVSATGHREQALKRDPALPAEQVAAAEHELAAGRGAEALELCELALALAPRDLAALALKRRAATRRKP
jgi:tetratricopeptide (TPR) repeat protein